jgi:hypothetical protein
LPSALILWGLTLARPPEDDTAELRAIARANTRLLQIAAIDDEVLDADIPIKEADHTALLSLCDMDLTELQIYMKMVEVYDRARSHFLFDIVEAQVKRCLNAERLKAEAENPAWVLTYEEYRKLLLQRTQTSELTQDLLSYILKPREEGCPIYLWASERISESNLLTANGLTMSDQAWSAYALAFITSEERQVLQIPSLADRASYGGGRGYTLTGLATSISAIDPTTLKKFRQSACTDLVALQILGLVKSKDNTSSSTAQARPPRFAPRAPRNTKESYAVEIPPRAGKGQRRPPARLAPNSSRLDQPSSSPQGDGRVDMLTPENSPSDSR